MAVGQLTRVWSHNLLSARAAARRRVLRPVTSAGSPASPSSLLAEEGVNFCASGDKLILLLGGHDKGEHPSARRQQREIAEARRRLVELAAFDERYWPAHQLMVRRRELGLSQAKLARMTGIGQADISRLEGGRANPTLATLAAVAHALGLQLGLAPLEPRADGAASPAARRSRRAPDPA
jgi:DNA-binding phage protein